MNEQPRNEFREAHALLRERFPDIRCVRCESDRFIMRVWKDNTLTDTFADARMVELVCENCGFVERHLMEGLKGDLTAPPKPSEA
jgi:hypothetical protein